MENILSIFSKAEPLTQIITLVFSVVTIIVAFLIPRRIMVNQLYSDLLREYRSSEMGAAIFSVFHFYVEDCKKDVNSIASKYKEKYEKQINELLKCGEPIDYAQTLHFQRRLIAQFYSGLAYLRYKLRCSRLSTKQLRYWFTSNELQLLAIILYMAKPAREVFKEAGDIPDPSKDKNNAPMNELLYRFFKDMKQWLE
jgi:hypothetical protein